MVVFGVIVIGLCVIIFIMFVNFGVCFEVIICVSILCLVKIFVSWLFCIIKMEFILFRFITCMVLVIEVVIVMEKMLEFFWFSKIVIGVFIGLRGNCCDFCLKNLLCKFLFEFYEENFLCVVCVFVLRFVCSCLIFF